MQKRLPLIGLTLLMLIGLDILAATGIYVAGKLGGPFDKIVQYFDYGRSVPGKHKVWEENPNMPGNLYDVAWPRDILAQSAAQFAAAPADQSVARTYGMSFLNDIMHAAQRQRPGLVIDKQAGPSATPNFVFSLYQDDKDNRRAGDVVILGILSSSLAPMTTFSNSSWLFEQPAPFTYPIYEMVDDELVRIDPLITTAQQHRTLRKDPALRAAWSKQRRAHDAYYSAITHGWVWADRSPFLRLVRRYAATYHIDQTRKALLGTGPRDPGAFDYVTLFDGLFQSLAQSAEQEGTIPIVVLIQTRGDKTDLKAALSPSLERLGIPYLATTDYYDIRDPKGFKPDGHYKDGPNGVFGRAMLETIDRLKQERAQTTG